MRIPSGDICLREKSRTKPMSDLKLPQGENLLLTAFRAVAEQKAMSSTELAQEYQRYFKISDVVPVIKNRAFDRFSIADPSVRITIQSDTFNS